MDESVTVLVTPENNNSSGKKSGKISDRKTSNLGSKSSVPRNARASLGSFSDGGSSLRNSTGKLDSSNKNQDAIPHYLRASTGSCHDLCKYGRKHTFEPKPWRALSKKTTKPPSDQLIVVKSPVLLEGKKVTIAEPDSSHDAKAHCDDPPEIIKREVLLPSKKVEVSPKQELATGKKVPTTGRKSNNMSSKRSPLVKPKAPVMKPSPSSDTSEGKIGSSKIKDGKAVVASKPSLKEVVVKPSDASSSSRPSFTGTVISQSRKTRNLKLVSSVKDQSKTQKATSVKRKNEKVPEKILHVVKTESVDSLVESLEDPSNQSPKAVSHPQNPLSPHEEDHLEEEDEEDEIEHIKKEAKKLISSKNYAASPNKKESVGGNSGRTLKKGRTVVSKDKDSSAMKLKFKRGKIVELQAENNTPKKLRFRRGRLMVGNQDGKADVKRNLKKKEVAEDKDRATPIKTDRKVVLRHQDVQDKKDTQGLLNNVIEEAASKLVESRKSKVKALVGAFETVISLHESKPSSQAAN